MRTSAFYEGKLIENNGGDSMKNYLKTIKGRLTTTITTITTLVLIIVSVGTISTAYSKL
jgi:hypothetical protein